MNNVGNNYVEEYFAPLCVATVFCGAIYYYDGIVKYVINEIIKEIPSSTNTKPPIDKPGTDLDHSDSQKTNNS